MVFKGVQVGLNPAANIQYPASSIQYPLQLNKHSQFNQSNRPNQLNKLNKPNQPSQPNHLNQLNNFYTLVNEKRSYLRSCFSIGISKCGRSLVNQYIRSSVWVA